MVRKSMAVGINQRRILFGRVDILIVAAFVFIFTAHLFNAFEKVNDIREILRAACGQFELNKRGRIDHPQIVDRDTNLIWIRIGNGAGLTAARETASKEYVEGDIDLRIHESSPPARYRLELTRGDYWPK